MAYVSVDWATKVITVDQSGLTGPIQTTPIEVYQLDLDDFRLQLKNLEDDALGIPHVDTHQHNPPVTISGVTLGRVVEVINDYTVTFLPDAPWAVDIIGGNSNVSDRMNPNNVSIRAANSAGLTDPDAVVRAIMSLLPHIWAANLVTE